MASSARLVTIKRSGDDGALFPLSLSSCLFGRSIECDIRIQLPVVSKRHCKIEVKEHEAILYNFSSTNPTQVNGAVIDEPVQLRHGDIITIIDRSFRYESGSQEAGSRPTEFPGKSLGKEPSRRASRDSFCTDPDAKGQDTKGSKMTASRRSFVQAKGLSADSPASGGSKDSVSQDSSGHVEQRNRRNIGEPTSGDLFKKSRATGSSYRELKSSPAQSLSNSNKKESPFEKLYQSMKEELNVKSQKSCRKSEPPSDRATEESWETQLLVSCKARPKSSGGTPVIATSSPNVGKIWTERRSGGKGPAQTSTETAKTKTPVQNSQQLKDEDFRVTGRRNSVNPDDGEGAEAVHKIVTPGKLVTRNQTAVKVGDVASPADTPENSSSRKRRSIPAKVPSPETQKRLSLTQRLAPDEKKSPKNSFSKPEKLATAAEQTCSVLPGLSSVDISNFGDSIHESEGMPSKRRRVSFGGHLKPELFDENLPPNTPLKRGETPAKRKSLGSHSPAVLKKIIKEKPQSPGKQESSGVTPPRINDQRRRSGRTSLASSGSKFLCETDIPKKAGRKSGSLPAKRASISRSQHGILQMICSKRRSGASEANLIVAKSWADVVKLGVKQTQMKVVKPVPQKQASKRQRRPSTPQKPTSNLHNQFTTGHANSPCTIVVGRAQIEKVNVPARPYKMLNNLMLNRKVDFSEDLSGLTEMFKTPVKEKQQQMSDMGSVLSNSENLSEKQLQVTNSGDTPLPITSEILGEKVLSITQNTTKQQSDRYSASPTLRRRSIKHENTVQAPNIIHLEKKTPVSETELLKTASSMSKLKRSRELRHTLVGSVNEKTEAVLTEIISGRHLKKTFRGQEVDQQVQDSEISSQRCKENGELSEGTEKTSARRLSARKEKPTKDLIESQIVTQTAHCAEELLSQEQRTIQNLEDSMHMQNTTTSDNQGITKQKVDVVVNATQEKRWPKTPGKTTRLEGPACCKEHFETPNHKDEPIGDDKTKILCKSLQPIAENIKSNTKLRASTSGKKVDMKEGLSALTKIIHMSRETRHTAKVLECEHGDIKILKQSENEMLAPTVTRSKRALAKAKEKVQPLEDLTGFQELFLSPVPGDKIIKMPSKSPYTEPVRTLASTKRLSKTTLRKVDVSEKLSTLGKRTKSPGRAAGTPEPGQEENDSAAFMVTPKQKLDFTGNSTGHKRRSRTPKIRAQPLEDLDGFQELFQTPAGARDPVSVEESTKMSLESSQAGQVRTPASTKRLSKTALRKVDVREEPATPGERTKSPGRAAGTAAPMKEENDTTAFMETPKQKLDFTGNSTGHKRRSRTPKIRAQPLEDLDGFQELFQTPAGASDSVIVEDTVKMSLESSQAEPVRTAASTKRLSKTALSKVDVREEPATLGKRTKSPGRAAGTAEPVQKENGTTAFMETPKQKLDFTGNSTGHKRRSRKPKIRAQPLEDLDGFQELFQTPAGARDPVSVEESTKMSLDSSQAEPVRTPASTKRLSKTALRKVDVREEPATLGKRTKSPGRAAGTAAQEQEENGTTTFMETPKQKLESAGHLTGFRKQFRTPKAKAQYLEDSTGFQELFQTPDHANGPLAVGKTKKMSFNSPQPESTITLESIERQSRASMSEKDVKEELLESEEHLQLGEGIDTLQVPNNNKVIRSCRKPAKRKLDPTASVPGSKRMRCSSKDNTPCLEDLSGFQQLFQTPGCAKDSLTIETSTMLTGLQSGPVRIQINRKSLPTISLRKVDVTKETSVLQKQSPSRAPTATMQEDNGIEAIMETSKETLQTAADITRLTRRSQTPKEKVQPLEDHGGFQELFQTPLYSADPLIGNKRTRMSLKSPQPGFVKTPQTSKRQAKTSVGNIAVREMLSPANMPRRSTGEVLYIPIGPEEDDQGNKGVKESIPQTLGSSASRIVSKKQQGTHEERSQFSGDLFYLQELFQTPASGKEPMTVGETTKIALQSPQPGHIKTPASTKRLSKTSLTKVDVRELPILEKQTQSRGRAKCTPTPMQEEDDTTAFMETPKQKLDFTGNSTGHKRRSRTPKIRAQPLEDLDGFQELFQTPAGASDSVIVEDTVKMSLESSQAEPVRTAASTKRLSKTALSKVDVREELSTLGKRTKSPGRAAGTPEPGQEENDSAAFMETPKQKLDFTGNSTGHKRRSRKPKIRAQPLEDLDGFQELFQTPAGARDPVSVEESTKMSLESSQAEQVRTPASTKRLSKTALRKVDVREEPAILGKRTKSPGRAAGTPEPVQKENGTTAFMETTKQKLDFTGNSTGHKRRSRTPKIRAQPLEDLDGFQELFQTPAGARDPVSVEDTVKMSLESSQAEPVRTAASTKRFSKTALSKVNVREEPATLGKRTKSPGRAAGTAEPVQKENGTTAFMETTKQKLDFAENSAESKKRSRTPKIRAQPLEDLDGFQELFQTPAGARDPVSVEESAKMSLESSQAEPVRTPASTKRLSKTALRKVDVRGTLSPPSKPSYASQKVTPSLPKDHGSETKNVKVFLAQTLDSAVHVTCGKRQQGSYKKRSQSPEDLFGLQELLQTSGHYKDSVALDSLAKLPGKTPSPEPIDISVTSQRQPRTGLRKVRVKNELSGDIMHPQMSGEIVDLSREPEGEDKVIKTRKQSVKRKLDIAVNVPGSKRQRLTRAEKTLEDLPGSQELCQAPSLVMDSVIVDQTSEMLSKSQEPVDTTSETQPRSRLRRLGVTEEPIPQRKTTRVLRRTRNTHEEPLSDSKGIKELKESSAQKQAPAVSLTVRRNQPRTVKEKPQPLGELISFQEETATRMSSKSPPPEEKKTLADLNRQLTIRLFKVGIKEEPIAQRKQPSRETRNTLTEPMGDSINVEELKKSTKQKIDPVANVPVSKRPRRVPKEKAQTLELAGLKGLIQTLDHTEESASDKGPTQMPCNSLQLEQVGSLQTSPRRLRIRHGKVEADKELSAVRKTEPTSRQTMRSYKVPEIDDSGTQASKASIKQTLDKVAKVTGSRRQLRIRKDRVQPLEVLGDSKEITQVSDHSEKLTHDTSMLKSTLQQKPDPAKPLRTSRRVLRASKEDPKEVLVDTRDAAALQSKSNPFLSPKGKSARDGSILRTRALRSETTKQEVTAEKPVPKKQRAASSKRHVSPEPVKMKHVRIVSDKLESVEEQVSTIMKTEEMEAKRENPVTPDQKTPQSSRYRKKTNEKQPRTKFDASAEEVGIEKNEKTMKTASQETELQNPDDGAKKSTSQGKVSGKRTCLRSRGQTETPQPREAEEKTSKSGVEVLIKTQKEKGVSGESDVRCLRSRKMRVTLNSEPKPRVTRGTKKDAKIPKKDEDIVYTKKLRTRSHQKNEAM